MARERTLAAFRQVFATLGYEECVGSEPEAGFEKVVAFADGLGKPTHAARQLASGQWTSKLDASEDIEHALRDLEGNVYGAVMLMVRRAIPQSAP